MEKLNTKAFWAIIPKADSCIDNIEKQAKKQII